MIPRKFLFITLFLVSALSLYGTTTKELPVQSIGQHQYVSFHDIVNVLQCQYSFDSVTERGYFFHNQHEARFNTGFSILLVDGRILRSNYPVIRSYGDVLLPASSVARMVSYMYPEMDVTISGNKILMMPGRKGEEVLPPQQGRDRITFIVLDAGHGGKDPGALGRNGLMEKAITLELSRRLRDELRRELPHVKIHLTRTRDVFLELSERTEFANRLLDKNENGLFLSIHVNASLSTRVSGYETFFLSQNPTNSEARNTAALENNVIILEEGEGESSTRYGDVDYIEAQMLTTQIQRESAMFADEIQKGMNRYNSVFKSRGVKKADFFVLRGVLMPAALVEVGFISNVREARYLNTASHQNKIVKGLALGIKEFLKKYESIIVP